jgi:hypothetical protein
MMNLDLARALDPVVLATDCGIMPDPWQASLLRHAPRRSLLLCCRQAGKFDCDGAAGVAWKICGCKSALGGHHEISP